MTHTSFPSRRTRNSFVLFALVVASLLAAPGGASAAVLTFEGLPCQSSFTAFDGFTFSSNWVTQCDDDYSSSWGNSSGAPSDVTAAGNSYVDPSQGVTIARSQAFDLIGGMASAFLANDDFDFVTPLSAASLLIEGYRAGSFVGSVTVIFDPAGGAAGPGYAAFGGLAGLDELRFFSSFDQGVTSGLDYWLIDDLELVDAAVPEPSTLVLAACGLAAVVARARRARLEQTQPD
jgi:hypothetical protein